MQFTWQSALLHTPVLGSLPSNTQTRCGEALGVEVGESGKFQGPLAFQGKTGLQETLSKERKKYRRNGTEQTTQSKCKTFSPMLE